MTAKASKKAADSKKKPQKLQKAAAKAAPAKAATATASKPAPAKGAAASKPAPAKAAPMAPAKPAPKATSAKAADKGAATKDDPSDNEVEREGGLKKKELRRFREILLEKREEILRNAKRTLSEDMTLDSDDLADEMDLASSEYLQSFTLRLRGREKTFLKKIDHALLKIDDGSFGMCEDCNELISIKRLEARPETTLCIRCKEDQERMEKAYG